MHEKQIILPISTANELMDFAHASNQFHNDQHRNLAITLAENINLICKEWMSIGNEKNLNILGTITRLADDLYSAVGGIAGSLEGQSYAICCTHNGIADGQWQDTDFQAVGDIIRQVDTGDEHIPQMEHC